MKESDVRVLITPNAEHNYPRSDWVCWACGNAFMVLGSRGDEPCPYCKHAA
jgi:rubrerythrin